MFSYMEACEKIVQDVPFFHFDVAKEQILKKSPEEISRLASVDFNNAGSCFTFKSLGQDITVSYPECLARFTETGKMPLIEWHMPMLHYLAAADGGALKGELVTYAYVDKHIAHPQQFEDETGGRILKLLESTPLEKLEQACLTFGGVKMKSNADLYVKFPYLPKVDIFLQVWLAEEGMPGSAKLLFDKNCAHYLKSMDIDFAGTLLVDFLVTQCDCRNIYKVFLPT